MEIKEIEDFRITETESLPADWVLAVKLQRYTPYCKQRIITFKIYVVILWHGFAGYERNQLDLIFKFQNID